MKSPKNRRRSIGTAMRRGMLFSVGSMLLIQEKVGEFVEQAIEKGQEVEQEGRKLIQERRADRQHKKLKRIDPLHVHVDNTLERLDVPSRKDLDELADRVGQLTQKIKELESAG